MKIAFAFAGQGAQAVGMGQELNERHPAAAAVFSEADDILGWSVSDVCFNGPEEKLTESKYCQPAIYTMSSAALAAFRTNHPDIEPVGCGGLSLGEFAALNAAGVFSFADGLKLVAERGELMDQACAENKGGMASVLGGDPDLIKSVCETNGVDVANFNCPGQIVISGAFDKVKAAVVALKEQGLRKVIPLKVAGAYHSRLMKTASERFQDVIAAVPLQTPAIPVVQNFPGTFVDDPGQIAENLVRQVAGSVKWEECVKALIQRGTERVIEFGPGKVLSGLIKRTDKTIATDTIGSAEELEAFSL